MTGTHHVVEELEVLAVDPGPPGVVVCETTTARVHRR
jgi:hypothetical protein